MVVASITPVAALVPVLVRSIVLCVGPTRCRDEMVGRIRADFRAMGDLPTIAGAESILSDCCRSCSACDLGRR